MKYIVFACAILFVAACSDGSSGGEVLDKYSKDGYYLLDLIPRSEWSDKDAYFWDSLIEEVPEWKDLKYTWIASSRYGDQIIMTENSPLHEGLAIYIHGPDMAGPINDVNGWIENILYVGSDYDVWIDRVEKYGDEHSIGPGGIDRDLGALAEEYRNIYRALNPGLQW